MFSRKLPANANDCNFHEGFQWSWLSLDKYYPYCANISFKKRDTL